MKLLKRIGTTIPFALAMLAAIVMPTLPAAAQAKKPYIVVAWATTSASGTSASTAAG